ncbi:MAG TPA: tRNA pseudouridine(55) synthase TruB [Blastocatellia bacterium]|nr:tRNA pseudouridine(55) synthase TruB [Blastocatellia bacterium]
MDGLLVIDKPAGLTSHDVVARVRKLLKIRRVGHTGTLDPFATGVLLVCVGKATRLSQFLVGCSKSYDAVARVGWATDTQDCTGKPITPVQASDELQYCSLKKVLDGFSGRQHQTPPMYSAKKVEGVALHKLARKNISIERKSVEIEITRLRLESDDWLVVHDDGTREFEFHVTCSAGTYVRTLAHDIGLVLGYGAHLTALRRTAVGYFTLFNAQTLDSLAEVLEQGNLVSVLIPPVDMLPDMTRVDVEGDDAKRLINGQAVELEHEANSDQPVRIVFDNALVGIARYDSVKRQLIPSVILADTMGTQAK